MLFVAVVHGVTPYDQGQRDHSQFKAQVMDDIDAK
jgi:hypothetical protein